MDCIFCKIINGEIESPIVYEDDIVKVFLDHEPDTNGHMLIVPKKHIKDILDLDDSCLLHINEVSKKMYTLLEEKLGINGLTMLHNSGSAQNVRHFHLHLIPRDKISKIEVKKLPVSEIYKILTTKD